MNRRLVPCFKLDGRLRLTTKSGPTRRLDAKPGLTTARPKENRAMANHNSTTTRDANPAAEREARVIEILADAVLDVLPETRERALRVLDTARERVLAGPAVRAVPEPELFHA